MVHLVYNPPSGVYMALAQACALFVLAIAMSIAVWRAGNCKHDMRMPIVFLTVGIATLIVGVRLASTQRAVHNFNPLNGGDFPHASGLDIRMTLGLLAFWFVMIRVTWRQDKVVPFAAAFTGLFATLAILGDVGLHIYYNEWWVILATLGWMLTVGGVLVTIILWAYEQHKRHKTKKLDPS